jgi:hypothetical protein
MKKLVLAFAAAGVLASAPAFAESVVVRGDSDRVVVRHHDRDYGRRVVRRDVYSTGSVGCKTVTIRKHNEDGDLVVKKIRRCH